MRTGHRPPPPWRRPSRLVWFALSLAGACWLTLHMPHPRSAGVSGAQVQAATRTEPAKKPLAHLTDKLSPVELSASDTEDDDTPPMTSRMTRRTPAEKLLSRAQTFGRLFAIVGIAAFLGGLMEARRWHMILARVMGKLTHLARLPEVVGLAMPTALCSNAAANSILVSSHAAGHIRTSALIAGGMANSYLAYVSHSIRVMYPVIGAIGLPGALYFGAQFSGGLLVLFGVFLWNRWYVSGHASPSNSETTVTDKCPLPWGKATRQALERALTLLFRMVCLTVPLMLGIEWLLKNGAFSFWEQLVPEQVTHLFPVELVSVVAAQMGGLVQSSAVAANLRAEGLISNAQILLAMLVGSAVGNPFRTLRRNLPSALGIFSPAVACTIVVGMQCSRFVVTVVAAGAVVCVMRYML